MSKILIVHRQRGPRKYLEGRAAQHHEAKTASGLADAMRAVTSSRPDVIVAGLDVKKPEAFDLLRFLKRNGARIPVVLVGPPAAVVHKAMAMKLGAAGFVEYPMEQDAFDRAITNAQQHDQDAYGSIPPITPYELDANLTELEKKLNRHMVCFAGRNQVYLQSLIMGNGKPSKPRVALKCALRKQFGHTPNVYFEYIRDVCCGDPTSCPAHQEFRAKHSA